MSTAEKRRYTAKEYLAFERGSEIKHAYYNGEIFAMTGSTREHNLIVGNLVTILGNQLAKLLVEIYPCQMRIKGQAEDFYTYSDVVIVSNEPKFEHDVFDTLLNPLLIVEVLSESTEAYDRGRKFGHYRTIESLVDYVLVSQTEYRIEVFTRDDSGRWILSEALGREAAIEFPSLNCRLTLDDVYYRIEFSPPADSQAK